MKLGILKDIKKEEYRVIRPPSEVENIIQDGHQVLVERSAGERARLPRMLDYVEVGATLTDRYEIYRGATWSPRSGRTRLSILCCARDRSYLPACIQRPIPQEVDELPKEKKVTALCRRGQPSPWLPQL